MYPFQRGWTALAAVVFLGGCTGTHGLAAASVRRNSSPTHLERPGVPGGRLRFAVSDDATGRDLPVRVTVRGVDGTPDPVFGPPSSAAGAGMLVVAPSGRGEVALRA